MLSPEQIDAAGDAVAAVYADIEAQMLDRLVETLCDGGALRQRDLTALALLSQTHARDLQGVLDANKDAVDAAVRETVEAALRASDEDDVRRLGEGAPMYPQQVEATVQGVARILARDNIQMLEGARQAFLDASVEAVTRVNAGAMTTERALHSAVRRLERGGIPIITYQDGRTGRVTVQNKVDVAVRRHIRTQIAQDGARLTMDRLSSLDVALVEVSSHEGARPSHAEWQGRVYSLHGEVRMEDGTKYEDFYTATRYGSVDGLLGANCRHSFGPYRHGAPRAYEPDPKHQSGLSNDEVYEMTQQQRYLERQIRECKREVRGAQQVHDSMGTLESRAQLAKAQQRLKSAQSDMRGFIEESNARSKTGKPILTRHPNREWAGDMPKGKAVQTSGRNLNEFLEGKAVKTQLQAKGVSASRASTAIKAELKARGLQPSDFKTLTASEQQGIFRSILDRMPASKRATAKANAGKHVAIKEYIPCTKKSEALQFAKDELGFKSVSGVLTIAELNELNAAFYRLMQQLPFMKGFVQTIKTGKMHACAYFSSNRVSVGAGQFAYEPLFKFDRSSLASASRDCVRACKKNANGVAWWTQKHDASGIIAHEFGHALEYKITMKRLGIAEGDTLSIRQVAAFNQAVGSVSREIVEKAFKRVGIDYTEANVMKHVSEYGNKNTRETLAEALSCEDESNALCNAIKDVTRETLEKEGLL